MADELRLEHLDSEALKEHEDAISALYRVTYRDELDDPFHTTERFMERIRNYSKAPGFEFVLGITNDNPAGLALGYPLPAQARWWRGLTTPVDPELIEEDGTRTFALCELMTHPDWQGKGIGHRLHDELLFKRPEQRATLLVDSDNDTARRAYEKWGWRQIGKIRPGLPDAPHYDALILDLTVSMPG
ncbi:GNAT family N-acetyltransferase [Pseudonocardia acaciae]|uniref:GNAT family N-acetyltransferase n=1 Tax=Pseudonocardia acaciae TaxID=551276 RepID=UPI000A011BE0|nr:GNAT family N-acetyltransferase [Pseudonocardia acaciae]